MIAEISMQCYKRQPEDIFFYHLNARPSDDILSYIDVENQSITYGIHGEFILYNINYRNSILLSDFIYLSEKQVNQQNIQYLIEVERLITDELCKAQKLELLSLSEYNLLLVETHQVSKYQYGFKVINLGQSIKNSEDHVIQKINRITLNKPKQKVSEALFPYLRINSLMTFSKQQFEVDTANLRENREFQQTIEKIIDFDEIRRETICHQYFIQTKYMTQKISLNSIASIINQYWINIEQSDLTTFQKYLIYAVQFSLRDTESLKMIYHHLKTIIPYLLKTNDYYKTLAIITQTDLHQNLSKEELINILDLNINEQQQVFPKQEAKFNLLKQKKTIFYESYYLENQQSQLINLYQQKEKKFYNKTKEFQFIKDILASEFINNCQNIALSTFFKNYYEQLRQTTYDRFFIQLVIIEKLNQQISFNEIEQNPLLQFAFIKAQFQNAKLDALKQILTLEIIQKIDVAQQKQESEDIQQFCQSLSFVTLNQIIKSFQQELVILEAQIESLLDNWINKSIQNHKELESSIQQWIKENQIKEKVYAKLYPIWNPDLQLSEIEAIISEFGQQLAESLQNLNKKEEEETQRLVMLAQLYSQEPVQQLNLLQLKQFILNQQIYYLKIESNKLAENLKNYFNNLNPKIINENDLIKVDNLIKSLKLSLNIPISKFCQEQQQEMLYQPSLAAVKVKFYQLFWITQGEKKIVSIYQQFTNFDLALFKIKLKAYFSNQELSEANIPNQEDSLSVKRIKIINNASSSQPIKGINPQLRKTISIVQNTQVINNDNNSNLYNLKEQEYLNSKQLNLYKFQKQSIYQNHFCNSSLQIEEFFKLKYYDLVRENQFDNQNTLYQLDQFYEEYAHPLILETKFQNQLESYLYIEKIFKYKLRDEFYSLIDQEIYEKFKLKQENVYDRLKNELSKAILNSQEYITFKYNKVIDLFQQNFEASFNEWQEKQEQLSQIVLSNIKDKAFKQLQLKWTPLANINFESIFQNILETDRKK